MIFFFSFPPPEPSPAPDPPPRDPPAPDPLPRTPLRWTAQNFALPLPFSPEFWWCLPPKFHEKTPRGREKERKWERERAKKARNFGPAFGPPPFGRRPSGPPLFLGLGSYVPHLITFFFLKKKGSYSCHFSFLKFHCFWGYFCICFNFSNFFIFSFFQVGERANPNRKLVWGLGRGVAAPPNLKLVWGLGGVTDPLLETGVAAWEWCGSGDRGGLLVAGNRGGVGGGVENVHLSCHLSVV